MSSDPPEVLIKLLSDNLEKNPDDWESRKQYARALYDSGKTKEAGELIWAAPTIPNIDMEIGFAAKILAKGTPRRAIRLLSELQQLNEGKAVQNMAIANALLHHGMVMQAARFYGAALQVDPTLVNPNIEHFLLWVDDSERLWGEFDQQPKIFEELPWIKRETKENAASLAAMKSGHTTPIKIPGLAQVPGELNSNPLYTQDPRLNRPVTPPPAVTIPLDRVENKYLLLDDRNGAETTSASPPDQHYPVGGTFGAPLPPIAPRIQNDASEPAPSPVQEPETQTEQPPETPSEANQISANGSRTILLSTANSSSGKAPLKFTSKGAFARRGDKVVRVTPKIDPRSGAPVKRKTD